MPTRLSGLGLRSAVRTVPSAYLAAWIDAAAVLSKKIPVISAAILAKIDNDPLEQCLVELLQVYESARVAGVKYLPTRKKATEGAKPPVIDDADAGEWRRGWQFHICSGFETFFRSMLCYPRHVHLVVRCCCLNQVLNPVGGYQRSLIVLVWY